MDYSAISNDPEHQGASPWGSPRADRTPFPTSGNGDIPSSPFPGQHHSSETADRDEEAIAQAADLSAQLQSAQLGDPDYGEEQSPFAVHQSPADQQRQQLPARYQTGVRQPSRQPAPAYKIQAKITGLERTGKKDPILRFDVHVSRLVNVVDVDALWWWLTLRRCSMTDQYPQIPYHPIPRCSPDSHRVCQARRPLALGQSGSSGPRRAAASYSRWGWN